MSNQGSSACGGGGAGFKGKIAVFEDGNYDVVVGSGAISRARYQSTVDSGTATTISKDGVTLLSAGGGTGGSAWIGGASGGVGGTLVNNFTVVESEVSANGNNGWGGNKVVTSGANGPISGHTWGKSGWSSYGWAGGNVGPSYHGYLMIKYVGPAPDTYTFTITPTPSDATVEPITCHIHRLEDEEQTPEVMEEIEQLKQERSKKVIEIQKHYPYPEES